MTKGSGIRKLILGLALCLLLAGGTAGARALTRYQVSTGELFDTVSVIIGYAEDEETFTEQAKALMQELREYHELYDIYNHYEGINNAKTVNDQAGGEPVAVDRRLIDLLLLARELAEDSGGAVDVTLGAVLRIWHTYREAGIASPETAALPEAEALAAAAEHTGFDLLEIDEEAGTVRLTDPEASLDLGAMAKGYAAQRVCESFAPGFLVNLGGNVYATGPKPTDGSAWTVGIQDPDGTGSDYLHAVTLVRGAVVTSGDYQRYYTVDGVRYHHLIDPTTLRPGNRWRAVTVLHEHSGVADGLSTALFLMDQEAGAALAAAWDAEAVWVGLDGQLTFSAGYEERIRK